MNELDITNFQAIILIVAIISLLLYLNHLDRRKSSQNEQVIKTTSEDLNPCYGRYIQLGKGW